MCAHSPAATTTARIRAFLHDVDPVLASGCGSTFTSPQSISGTGARDCTSTHVYAISATNRRACKVFPVLYHFKSSRLCAYILCQLIKLLLLVVLLIQLKFKFYIQVLVHCYRV